jgi:hypothetical protein
MFGSHFDAVGVYSSCLLDYFILFVFLRHYFVLKFCCFCVRHYLNLRHMGYWLGQHRHPRYTLDSIKETLNVIASGKYPGLKELGINPIRLNSEYAVGYGFSSLIILLFCSFFSFSFFFFLFFLFFLHFSFFFSFFSFFMV